MTIALFLDKNGYYITGQNIELIKSCAPRTDDEISHLYTVLIHGLLEFVNRKIDSDIIVYNDTRIVDELNGNTEPINTEYVMYVRRLLIPHLPVMVWFHKKPNEFIRAKISNAYNALIGSVDVERRNRKAMEIAQHLEESQKQNKYSKSKKFKESWLNCK